MAAMVIEDILRQRELRNERTVAIVRFILALAGIWEILAFLGIVPKMSEQSGFVSSAISIYLLLYSGTVLAITLRGVYIRQLKYFVIFFDYLYVGVSFLLDKALIADRMLITWLLFGGCIVFYMINLLRYSKGSTVFSLVLSVLLYLTVNLYYKIPVASFAQVGIALSLLLLIGLLITISNLKMLGEVNAKKMMERYLSPELIGEMYKSGTSLLPGGATREVAILFSDIRGFTELSESMKAEEVVNFLNGYLSRMTDVIFRHGGTLDKFIGDAIMTVFGAPVRRDNDELRAVQTAIDMQKAIVDLPISISVGIGVHSGEAVVGNIGSEKRLDYTVIGDNVNLCSRIEGLTKYYGTPILISDSVLEKLPKQCEAYGFFIRPIDRVVVKGRSGVVGIHEVLWFDGEEQKGNKAELKNDFEKAHLVFIQRDFRAAQSLFEKIGCDSVSAIYVQRCKEFIKNPPPANWNGAFVMRNK